MPKASNHKKGCKCGFCKAPTGKAAVRVKPYCRRPGNRTIRPGSKRYTELPF